MDKINFFENCKKKYNCKDKILFYTKQRQEKCFEEISRSIKRDFPSLKVFSKHYEVFTDIEDLPKFDLFEILVILPNDLVKSFYNLYKDLGLFLKNEEPINPLKEVQHLL